MARVVLRRRDVGTGCYSPCFVLDSQAINFITPYHVFSSEPRQVRTEPTSYRETASSHPHPSGICTAR
jgi:hypothetical protein